MAWNSGFQLRVIQGTQEGTVTPLDQQVFVLGRASSPGEKASGYIFYREPTVSRVHAELRWNEKKKLFILHHKSNTNPTLLEGTPVDKKSPRPINPGERIQMGLLVLALEPARAAAASGTLARSDDSAKSGKLGEWVQQPVKASSELVGSVLAALSSLGTNEPGPNTTRMPKMSPPQVPVSNSNNGMRFNSDEAPQPQAPPPVVPRESEPAGFLERDFGNPQNTPLGFHLAVAQGPDNGQSFPISDHLMVVGRSAGRDDPRAGMGVLLSDESLPKEAAMLVWQSREGTYGLVEAEGNKGPLRVRRVVNGVPREYGLDQTRPLLLSEGDVILLGRTALVLRKGDIQARTGGARPGPSRSLEQPAPSARKVDRVRLPRSGNLDPSEVPTHVGNMGGPPTRKVVLDPSDTPTRISQRPPGLLDPSDEATQVTPPPRSGAGSFGAARGPSVQLESPGRSTAPSRTGGPTGNPTPISLTPSGGESQASVWARPATREARPSAAAPSRGLSSAEPAAAAPPSPRPSGEFPRSSGGRPSGDLSRAPESRPVATAGPPEVAAASPGIVPRGFLGGNRPSVLDRLDSQGGGGATRSGYPEAFATPGAAVDSPTVGPMLDPSEVPTSVGLRSAPPRSTRPAERETISSRPSPEEVLPSARPGPTGPENKIFEPNVLSWPFKPHVDYVFDFLTGPNKGCHIDLCQNELSDDRTFTMGSSGGRLNEIVLESPDVPQQAATLRYRGGRFGLLNEGPDDSILVNRMPLKRGDQVVLMTGDRIDLADSVFRFLERKVVELLQGYQVLVESGVDQDQDKHFPFFKQRLLIGRGKNCDIRLNDLEVSRVHVALVHREGKFFIQHRSETNPTFLNGVSLLQGGERLIQPGDRVRLSSLTLLQFAKMEPPKKRSSPGPHGR